MINSINFLIILINSPLYFIIIITIISYIIIYSTSEWIPECIRCGIIIEEREENYDYEFVYYNYYYDKY